MTRSSKPMCRIFVQTVYLAWYRSRTITFWGKRFSAKERCWVRREEKKCKAQISKTGRPRRLKPATKVERTVLWVRTKTPEIFRSRRYGNLYTYGFFHGRKNIG